jgi:hypothetical protein
VKQRLGFSDVQVFPAVTEAAAARTVESAAVLSEDCDL